MAEIESYAKAMTCHMDYWKCILEELRKPIPAQHLPHRLMIDILVGDFVLVRLDNEDDHVWQAIGLIIGCKHGKVESS